MRWNWEKSCTIKYNLYQQVHCIGWTVVAFVDVIRFVVDAVAVADHYMDLECLYATKRHYVRRLHGLQSNRNVMILKTNSVTEESRFRLSILCCQTWYSRTHGIDYIKHETPKEGGSMLFCFVLNSFRQNSGQTTSFRTGSKPRFVCVCLCVCMCIYIL